MSDRPPDVLPVDVVVRHALVADLGRDGPDQRRAEAFAIDLARWLVGRPHHELGPLARVVTIVAQREFRDTRRICKDRPLLAVEAAARATATLWPLLREATPPAEGDGEGDGGGEGDAASEDDEAEAVPAPTPADEDHALEQPDDEQLGAEGDEGDEDSGGDEDSEGDEDGAGGDVSGGGLRAQLGADEDDPDVDALIAQLQVRLGASAGPEQTEEAAAVMLTEVTQAAAVGAIETDRVARHLERFLPGIGWSNAPGQLQLTLLQRLEQVTALIGQLDELRELADALGRLEDASDRKGPQEGGREEVVGVRLGGEVAHALPGELALLSDPDTEDLFYQRLLDRRLISLELRGTGDEGQAEGNTRGPIIACIDTSASMEGAPELAAKAVVLAVTRKAVPRGRPVHLILFGGPGERTEIRLRRGLGGLEGMLDFLMQSFHSGTDFDGPLLRAMDLLEEQSLKAADVLVVTDGLCRAGPHVVERVAQVRQDTGVRVWSVVLGHRDLRGVEPFSDEVLQLDPGDAARAAGLVRSMGRR